MEEVATTEATGTRSGGQRRVSRGQEVGTRGRQSQHRKTDFLIRCSPPFFYFGGRGFLYFF